MRAIAPAVVGLLLLSCGDRPPAGGTRRGDIDSDRVRAEVERALDQAATRMAYVADSIDDILKPVPLLTAAQESAMLRYGNAEHLVRARALGTRPANEADVASLREAGRLVQLEDSTALWVVRELDHSIPLVTPDTRVLLTRIAQEFQRRLAGMALPRYRLEVTSVLRTAESQADLRASNPNAAAGASTHEFGTTLDIAYSSFAAPQDVALRVDVTDVPWLERRINVFAAAMLEAQAARKSRELQAVLGEVLLDFQQAGDVLVRLERQQPVFHITVAKRQSTEG